MQMRGIFEIFVSLYGMILYSTSYCVCGTSSAQVMSGQVRSRYQGRTGLLVLMLIGVLTRYPMM